MGYLGKKSDRDSIPEKAWIREIVKEVVAETIIPLLKKEEPKKEEPK